LAWRAVVEAETGSVVELGGDLGEVLAAEAVEVAALGEVLAQQPVGVLVGATK
jgi:hypothetical protein